jgi:hypothetical protein
VSDDLQRHSNRLYLLGLGQATLRAP